MINKVYIKDFAIIDEIELPLKDGLTVITGETGSGKSILLQALNVSLGGRTTKTMVRSSSERAVVETLLDSNYYRRILNKSGRAKSFINDEPLNESDFRNACVSLVDFHGQHEQQFIMNEFSHIDYLDSFCSLEPDVEYCKSIFNSIKHNERLLTNLIEKRQYANQQKELLTFQLKEIQSINPLHDEDIELENELNKLKHLDEIVESAQRVSMELIDDDESVYNRLSSALIDLEKLINVDDKLKDFADLLRTASVNIQEASVGFSDYINTLNHDKNRLIEVQDRLGALDSLKRKYGGSIKSIIDNENEITDQLYNFSSIDSDMGNIKNIIEEEKEKYRIIAVQLTEKRESGSQQLSTAIEEEMHKLNMPEARFRINISRKIVTDSFVEYNAENALATEKGIDIVQFLLSANPGERLKPLVEIASGGEISRIMLAIKTVFQKFDPVDSLIFDEIDSGISGSAAEKVAQSLLNLSNSKQVICITHLPQIAKSATNHLHITKSVNDGITKVKAEYLDEYNMNNVVKQLTAGE